MAEAVTITLKPPLEFIRQQAGAFRRDLEDLGPLWDRFEITLSAIEKERFNTAGYGAWPELAESTIAQKEAGGWPLDPLIRTGDLYESLTDPARAAENEPLRFTWGSDVEYAEYHQDGTDRMPPRPVLDIRLEDRRELEADMVSWVNEVSFRTWGRV